MCNFYANLYTGKSTNDEKIANYIEKFDCPKLNTQDKEIYDKLTTLDECKDAVLNMKNKKSPGLDGLPSEFYKCYWNLKGPLFYEVLLTVLITKNCHFHNACLSSLFYLRKGIRVIKKINNFRPHSLTNTDYKIIALIFARRLQKVIDNLIGIEQSAYIKGRFIGNTCNARTI